MAHRADRSELAIKQLKRRQQPVPRERHHAKIGKDVGEIAPSRCEQQHSHNQTAESKRFDKIPGAVGEDRHAGTGPRKHRGMPGKPVEKMFFGAVHFHRLNPAEHLLRFPENAANRYF